MLTLTYCTDNVDLNDVHKKIADVGYSTEKHEATGTSNCGSSEENLTVDLVPASQTAAPALIKSNILHQYKLV